MKRYTRRQKESGQVIVEYVIMTAMALLLVFALTALFKGVSSQGERMVKTASWNIP